VPLSVAVDCADARWLNSWPSHAQLAMGICHHVLPECGLRTESRDVEVSLLLTDDPQVRDLNRAHRGKDKPTNVLSFPAYDAQAVMELTPSGPPVLLGDIVLAYETVMSESQMKKISFPDHGAHLIIHGLLHLLGFDHVEDDDAETMEAKEIDFCRFFGIADPYS